MPSSPGRCPHVTSMVQSAMLCVPDLMHSCTGAMGDYGCSLSDCDCWKGCFLTMLWKRLQHDIHKIPSEAYKLDTHQW